MVCKIREQNFRGWDALTLSNGLIELTAVPVIGGRVMAYDLNGFPYLYVDRNLAGRMFTPEEHMGDGSMPNWKNYGGDKTWPSPQGWSSPEEWPGPPDAVLDSGCYSVTARVENPDGSAELEMTSPPDAGRTGIQIVRRFKIYPGSTRVTQTLTFHNISHRTVRWSIWDVNQLNGERRTSDGGVELEPTCAITTRLNPESKFSRGFNVMFGDENNPQWQADRETGLFTARYQWEIGKVGLDSTCGWIGFSNAAQGYAMAERYQYLPGEVYPDQGVTVECWTVGRGRVSGLNYEGSGIYLMEIEVLSPFYTFAPGESRTFVIEWGACRLNDKVTDAGPGGVWSRNLTVQRSGRRVQLTGTAGVFDPGDLQAVGYDAAGRVCAQTHLGAVSPLAEVPVDVELELPETAVSLALLVQTAGGACRQLAAATL